MTDCDLDFDFPPATTGETCTDVTEETCTVTDHQLLPPPPRKVPLRVRWYLRFLPVLMLPVGCFVICFGHRYFRLAGVLTIGLLLFLFVCLYAESGRLIDRHRAGWDAIEEQGTVEAYRYVPLYAGILLGYQCYEIDYTFQTPEGEQREGKAYKHVHFRYSAQFFQDDKSFQQGDIVPLEKYQYSNGIYRVMGMRAFPSNWLCFFFCFCLTGGLLACWLSASKSIEILRSHEVTTVRLTGSETVEGKRQDSYQFTVGDKVITRTVLKPESSPALDKKVLFYDSSKPESSTFLDDICIVGLMIENGRMRFLELAEIDWGIALIALFYPLSLAMITLTILAPYLPF